jgi:hypothetical protein
MDMKPALRACAAAAVLMGLCQTAQAQSRLETVKSLRCTFRQVAVASWKPDGAASAAVRPATLTLRFESIDTDSGTAVLRTGSMQSEITARLAEGYLHLMQAFRTGPLYTTTVFEPGAKGAAFKAVHSRHEYFTVPLPGATSSPEQYYGECMSVQ